MKHKHVTRNSHRFPAVLAVTIFATVGAAMFAFSLAATTDEPHGFADFCRLENNKTVIYGWAHDRQANAGPLPNVNLVVGSKSTVASSSISGYRDAAINKYLTNRSIPTASIYGFKATFTDIYKGSRPAISGTILDVGTGSNQPLSINQDNVLAQANNGAAYFPGKIVPDACLPTKPSIPVINPPAPNPVPTNPIITPTPGPTKPRTSTPSTNTTPSTSPTPTEELVEEESFAASLTLTDQGQVLSNVTVKLSTGTEQITDENGKTLFTDLPSGNYNFQFEYQSKPYEYVFDLASEEGQAQTKEISLDVSTLQPVSSEAQEETSEPAAAKKSSKGWVLPVLLLLLAIGAAVFFVVKKIRARQYDQTVSSEYYPQPTYTQAPLPTTHERTPEEIQNNVGVSLKDMVIDSMREEAAHHKKDTPDDPQP